MSGDIDLTEATAAGVETWINGMGTWQSVDHRVRAILTAALPHIREQIAREIETLDDSPLLRGLASHNGGAEAAIEWAAATARGES